MFKKILLFIFLILGVFILSISSLLFVGYLVFGETHEDNYFRLMKEDSNIELSSCKIIEDDDSHGGFLGDGITKRIYDCSDSNIKISNLKKWKELPLSENLSIEIYGGTTKDGKQYLSKEKLPKIENGYYYFIDNRSQEDNDVEDIHSDEILLERASQNYILGIYDIDIDRFYYYEVDT